MKSKFAGYLTATAIAVVALGGIAGSMVLFPDAAQASPGGNGSHGGGNGASSGNGGGNSHAGGNGGGSSHASSGSSSSHGGSSSHAEGSSGSGKGSVHSELKGLNAAHASPTAMANAAPNSQVGRIATYRNAALATQEQSKIVADAQSAYDAFAGSYTGPSAADLQAELDAANAANADLQTQIDALDPTSPTYETDRAALEAQMTDTTALSTDLATATTYETQLEVLNQELIAAQTAYAQDAATEADALTAASGGRTLSSDALAELRRELGL